MLELVTIPLMVTHCRCHRGRGSGSRRSASLAQARPRSFGRKPERTGRRRQLSSFREENACSQSDLKGVAVRAGVGIVGPDRSRSLLSGDRSTTVSDVSAGGGLSEMH